MSLESKLSSLEAFSLHTTQPAEHRRYSMDYTSESLLKLAKLLEEASFLRPGALENAGSSRGSESNSTENLRKVYIRNIPANIEAQGLIRYLESALGRPSGIANCTLCMDTLTDRFRGSAYVVFHSRDDADLAVNMARRGRLHMNGTKISIFSCESNRSRPSRNDRPDVSVGDVTLHMGCMTGKNDFYKLWTVNGCTLELDNWRKQNVFRIIVGENATGCRNACKLEWRLRDIHDLSWCNMPGIISRHSSMLMLTVWLAPQIFKQEMVFFNPLVADDVWNRAIDFSPEAYIAQSFVYCLEVPKDSTTKVERMVQGSFASISEKHFWSVVAGNSYSITSKQTVPILSGRFISTLSFEIQFVLNSLVQNGYLSGPTIDMSFIELLEGYRESKYVLHVLKKLWYRKETCFNPRQWFLREMKKLQKSDKERITENYVEQGLIMVRKVCVTPSRVYFIGPEVDVSNRVTRHYIDYIDDFIRVTFVEEDFSPLVPNALLPAGKKNSVEQAELYKRIVSILIDGITIGDKKFEFLAFSSSQLRENSVWMFSSNSKVTAHDIREWMGDFFSIRNVAKCAARMGQSFSSSTKSVDVPRSEVEQIPDIYDTSGTYIFSDGIGKISAAFATKVAKKCRLKKYKKIPSLYQIRYGGFKGVVAVDPTSSYKLSLRPSMDKFESKQIGLDILNWSHPIPSYLNREIINLLSTLGVKDNIFEEMQGQMFQKLNEMLEDGQVALDVLQTFSGGESHHFMVEMINGGFNPAGEPFLKRMLHAFRAFQLMQVRKKTRIFVPKGRLLMGCLDETATLDYGQIYISVTPTPITPNNTFGDGLSSTTVYHINGVPQTVSIVEGKVIVAKNPCLHPGDVRVLTAVNVPALHHLVDAVVFPQKGPRPHPNECSGSDLDGDLYFVSWDWRLIPPTVHEPQDYQPAPEQRLDRPVCIPDIVNYFAEFMINNSLGVLSNAHIVWADLAPDQARDPRCLELAKLCSIAVDFPKTGVPAIMPIELRPTKYPDFMEKTDKSVYESERVLGKLFRSVLKQDEEKIFSSYTKREATKFYDKELEFYGFEKYIEEAISYKNCYDEKLLNLMYQYDVKTEAEIVSGNILMLSKFFQKKPGEVKERIMMAMRSLKSEARSWLKDSCLNGVNDDSDVDDDDDDDDSGADCSDEELAKASAWYYVTYHPSYVSEDYEEEYPHLLSFPWVVYDRLLEIKKKNGKYSRKY